MFPCSFKYHFSCGPQIKETTVTIHSFEEKGMASVAEISWKGRWLEFFEWSRGRRFGFNPETKTWKIRCCEILFYSLTDGFNEENLAKDGFFKK